jgi:hypothetical protein
LCLYIYPLNSDKTGNDPLLFHFLVFLVFRFETAIVRAFHYFCGEYPVEKEDFLCKAYLEPINP